LHIEQDPPSNGHSQLTFVLCGDTTAAEVPMAPFAIRAALLSTLVLAAAPAVRAGPPEKIRPPFQTDFERCALRADDAGNRSLQGKPRLELLIRKTGNVYASFIWSEGGIEDRRFQRCLTSMGPLWVFPNVASDYQRAFAPSFVSSGSNVSSDLHSGAGITGSSRVQTFLPDINDLPEPVPMNVKAAQETLDIADWATQAERANAETVVKLYPLAIEHAHQALAENPNDPIALRALSQALAESGGDLVEARKAAERLVSLDQASEMGHEALLRVCLASKDDRCVFDSWKKARQAPDLQPRSRLLADLQGPTQIAVERLRLSAAPGSAAAASTQAAGSNAATGAAQPVAPADPCAAEKGDEAQALCVVKRCLDEGSAAYARELSSQNGLAYAAGDWRAKKVAAGKLLITRPIEPKAARPGEPATVGDRHDALWLVTLSNADQFVMRPTNTEARQITVRHNRCTARVVSGK